jgi:HEAT repeat protein
LRAAASERDERVEAHLARALSHPAWDLRRLAADLLGQRGDDSAKTLLRARLAQETEPLVREAIQRSLADAEGVAGMRASLLPPSFGGADE